MSNKRTASELDPEYDDISKHQAKRQRCLEQNAKAATVGKIKSIVQQQFTQELRNKEVEIDMIDQRLNEARTLLDRLRACIVANFYSSSKLGPNAGRSTNQASSEPPSIHPAVKKYLGKTVRGPAGGANEMAVTSTGEVGSTKVTSHSGVVIKQEPEEEPVTATTSGSQITTVGDNRASRFKIKKRIVVGNVSKYIPVDKREGNDQATHKWMVYVRGSREEPEIDRFVKKVWFFLHPSYRPNDLVEVTSSPFHLTRRGWGEFPVRVQLHFHDERNKRVDILHVLKLDRTYTGLQTLGSETLVDIELDREANDSAQPSTSATPTPSGTAALPAIDSSLPSVKSEPLSTQSTPTKCSNKSSKSKATPKKRSALSSPSPTSNVPQRMGSPVNAAVPPRFGTPPVGGAKDGWTHLQIKSEPSSPIPQIIQTPPKTPFITIEPGVDNGATVKTHRRTISPALNFGSSRSGLPSSTVDGPTGRMTPLFVNSSSAGPSPMTSPTGTPSKDPGWMHVQIKSEPTSPVQKASLGGWQSLSNLKTPPKSQPSSALSSPISSKTPERQRIASPVGGIKPILMNIGSIGSKTGSNSNEESVKAGSSALVSPGSSSTGVTSPVMSTSVSTATTSAAAASQSSTTTNTPALSAATSKSGLLVIQPTPPAVSSSQQLQQLAVTPKMIPPAQAAGTSGKAVQPTVYMKCVDNQGKIYLIPQHLLTRSPNQPAVTTTALTPQSKSVMLPSSQVLAPPSVNIQRPVQRGVVPQVICPTPAGGSLIRTAPPVVGQTSIILQSTPPAGQKGVLPIRPMLIQLPGQPNLAAVTTPSPAKTTPIISSVAPQVVIKSQVTTGQGQTAAPSNSRTVAAGQSVTPTNSRPSTPTCSILKPPSRTNTPTSVEGEKSKINNSDKKVKTATASLPAKPQESFVIIGGNIASLPTKPAMVFIDQETGKPIPVAGQQPVISKPSAVSLLSGTQFALSGSSAKSGISSSIPISNILQKSPSVVGPSGSGVKAVPMLTAAGVPAVRPATQLVLLQQKGQAHPGGPALPTQLLTQVARPPGNATKPQSLLSFIKTPPAQSLLNPAANHTVIFQQGSDPKVITSKPNVPSAQGKPSDTYNLLSNKVTLKLGSGNQKPVSKKYAIGGDAMRLHTPTEGRIKVRRGQELCLTDYNDLDELVSTIVSEHPLVCPHAGKSTFLCASSVEQFLQWNVGKRRAAEWLRACMVRRRVMKHIEGSTYFKVDKFWSTKDVVLWCRAHGFSPFDKETMSCLTREVRPLLSSGIKLDSYCNHEDIWQQVKEIDTKAEAESVIVSDDDSDIDIIGIETPAPVKLEPNSPLKKEHKPEFIAPSEGVEYIHDTCAEIGVVLRPQEVDPVGAPGVHSPVVEDMLLAVMQLYMGDIIRKSTSVIYNEHRIPEEITTADVHKAIMAMEKLDFLTNNYLGVVEGAELSDDPHITTGNLATSSSLFNT